jgi:hypothetical protein
MFADDDGFVNSPKGIMRQCGSSEDDLKILFAKKFLISFESGVIVIKHWRINNYLQKDRYKETVYTEERELLDLDEKGNYHKKKSDEESMYTQDMYTDCVYTQDRIGKDRIGKDIEIGSTTPTPIPSATENTIERVTSQMIVDLFNEICTHYPKVKSVSDSRKKAINARLKMYGIGDFRILFQKAEASSFLKGNNGRNWSATFDWLIKDSNMAKVLDGNYDDKETKVVGSGRKQIYSGRPWTEADEDLYKSLISIPKEVTNDD